MDKMMSEFLGGALVVAVALLLIGVIPAIFTIYGAITVGALISGGIAALIVPYIRKALKF